MGGADRIRSNQFFRQRLLTCITEEEVQGLLNSFKHEREELMTAIHTIMYYMKSISREEAWIMSPAERENCAKLIKERIELFEKAGFPLP